MNNRLRFDLDLWCFRGRVFGFPACSSGHSGSVRTFARTKGRDGLVPFLGVLGAFRQPSLKGHRQYVPAFSKYSPNAVAWRRNPALVRDRTILGTGTSPSTVLTTWRVGSVRPWIAWRQERSSAERQSSRRCVLVQVCSGALRSASLSPCRIRSKNVS